MKIATLSVRCVVDLTCAIRPNSFLRTLENQIKTNFSTTHKNSPSCLYWELFYTQTGEFENPDPPPHLQTLIHIFRFENVFYIKQRSGEEAVWTLGHVSFGNVVFRPTKISDFSRFSFGWRHVRHVRSVQMHKHRASGTPAETIIIIH